MSDAALRVMCRELGESQGTLRHEYKSSGGFTQKAGTVTERV